MSSRCSRCDAADKLEGDFGGTFPCVHLHPCNRADEPDADHRRDRRPTPWISTKGSPATPVWIASDRGRQCCTDTALVQFCRRGDQPELSTVQRWPATCSSSPIRGIHCVRLSTLTRSGGSTFGTESVRLARYTPHDTPSGQRVRLRGRGVHPKLRTFELEPHVGVQTARDCQRGRRHARWRRRGILDAPVEPERRALLLATSLRLASRHTDDSSTSANAQFTLSTQSAPFGLSDVGFDSAPTFADIDGDGDLDAFVGESATATSTSSRTPAVRLRRRLPPR